MKIEFKQIQNQTVKLKPEDGRIKGSVTLGPRPRFL
jgi:hypothetical protein